MTPWHPEDAGGAEAGAAEPKQGSDQPKQARLTVESNWHEWHSPDSVGIIAIPETLESLAASFD